MKEIPTDLFEELAKQPVPKPRKSKNIERTFRNWFYEVPTQNGNCDNPDCKDTRRKAQDITMVWTYPTGLKMCRICFMDGWLHDD